MYFAPCFSVSVVNFEHEIAGWAAILLSKRKKRDKMKTGPS